MDILFLADSVRISDTLIIGGLIADEGLFNLAFGAILAPFFGVANAYGTDVTGLNNAIGYFMLSLDSLYTKPRSLLMVNSLGNLRLVLHHRSFTHVSGTLPSMNPYFILTPPQESRIHRYARDVAIDIYLPRCFLLRISRRQCGR